jgi:DNA repair protein RadC
MDEVKEVGMSLRAGLPRERLMLEGPEALSDEELLAILIRTGPAGRSALEVARELLALAGGRLGDLGRMPAEAYRLVHGIGAERAVGLAAAMEIGRRRAQTVAEGAETKVVRASDVFQRFKHRLGDLAHEEFWVVYLRRSNAILAELRISRGGLSGTVADPKVIFGKALALRAAALILVHNHPSGNRSPSASDRQLTRNMKEAGSFLDLPVLDHLIITRSGYYSFADAGAL